MTPMLSSISVIIPGAQVNEHIRARFAELFDKLNEQVTFRGAWVSGNPIWSSQTELISAIRLSTPFKSSKTRITAWFWAICIRSLTIMQLPQWFTEPYTIMHLTIDFRSPDHSNLRWELN